MSRRSRGVTPMHHEWLLAGFGGQGILFLGDLLAQAAMRQGLQTSYMPTYGVAMRGGTANCIVRLSDDPIGSPLFEEPDAAIILNQQSFSKFLPAMRSGSLIIANSSMVDAADANTREDVHIVYVPATELARETAGTERATNMIALGAFLAAENTLHENTIEQIMNEERNPSKQKLVQTNKTAIQAGMAYVHKLPSSLNGA